MFGIEMYGMIAFDPASKLLIGVGTSSLRSLMGSATLINTIGNAAINRGEGAAKDKARDWSHGVLNGFAHIGRGQVVNFLLGSDFFWYSPTLFEDCYDFFEYFAHLEITAAARYAFVAYTLATKFVFTNWPTEVGEGSFIERMKRAFPKTIYDAV